MSIENNLKRIADGIEKNNHLVEQLINMQGGNTTVAPTAPVETPVAPAPAPIAEQPAPAPQTAPAPAAPTETNSVFNSGQELTQYVMKLYQELGPEKGVGIQNVLTNLGYTNINEIKPEHYNDFHSQCEALKAA